MTAQAGAYGAGIDLGTTFAAAAVYLSGSTEPIPIEPPALVSPSVLAPAPDGGAWLVGAGLLLIQARRA